MQDLLETVDEYKLQLISKKGEEFGMLNIKCTPSVMDLAYCDFRAFGVDLAKKSLRGSTGITSFLTVLFSSILFTFLSSLLFSPSSARVAFYSKWNAR